MNAIIVALVALALEVGFTFLVAHGFAWAARDDHHESPVNLYVFELAK
jgi:hypothetical protein